MILASTSQQRKNLINYISSDVKFMSSKTDEKFFNNLTVYENIKNVAKNKALAVFSNYSIKNNIIISADTVVSIDKKILLKPKSYDEAFNMIKLYESNTGEVISGVCIAIVENGKVTTREFTESSYIKFNNVTDDNIKKWLLMDDYLSCSGAIKIEKVKDIFDIEIMGSISNIIGLPLERLSKELVSIDSSIFKLVTINDVLMVENI